MKIALAQIQSTRGAIMANLQKHLQWVNAADAGLIIFPELSLTGYEPSLAKELATGLNDPRFDPLQELSNTKHITIGAGMPIKTDAGINIGMIIFQPNTPRELYTKQFLHADELPFFTPGIPLTYSLQQKQIALAICYELSVPDHASHAHERGAQIYIASVAKTAKGVEKASKELAGIAKRYSMTVLMANAVGICEDGECAGQSAVWNSKGEITQQLNHTEEGLLVLNSHT